MVPQSKTNESKPSKTTPGSATATKKPKKKRDSGPTDDEAGAGCKFPMSRVRRLVRAEDPTIRTAPDSIFLINKASEMFIEKLAEDAFNNMTKERKKSLQYKHLSSTVQLKKRYEFISDFVPEKVRAENALQERAASSDSRP